MRDKADDILGTLGLSAADLKAVKEAFDKHFICKYNVIYERARFNKRSQEPGESAEAFISAVYKLEEHCQYGPLQNEMIRDRLVVGIRHHGLSEKLQIHSELTLEKAVITIRQHEEIKKQQPMVRETNCRTKRDECGLTEIQEKVTQRLPDGEDNPQKGTKRFPERTEKLWTMWKRTSTLPEQLCSTGCRMQKMLEERTFCSGL